MDLAKRMDPEIEAVLGNFPVLDLRDIPAARQAHMARRAVANAGVAPSPTVIRQEHFVPGRSCAPDVRVRHVYPGAIHGLDGSVPSSALARRFFRDRDAALRRTQQV